MVLSNFRFQFGTFPISSGNARQVELALQIMEPHPVKLSVEVVRRRLDAQGLDGRYLPAHTGNETEFELKDLIYLILKTTRHDHCGEACFFYRAKKLHPDSLILAVGHFLRKNMLRYLDEECACRNQKKSPYSKASGKP